jgi:hypothetical protein
MNKDENASIAESIETIDNLSEFIAEKEKLLNPENKKILKKVDDRLHKIIK